MNEKPEAWTAADSLIWPYLAAKLIREKHAENERLREALEKIATVNAMDYEYVRWAKAALRREDKR